MTFTRRLTLLTLPLTAVALIAARASAQRAGEDTVPRTHVLPAIGLRVGTPQKASIAAGVLLGEEWQSNGRDHSRNVALFAEPGLGAGRASLAYVDHGYGSVCWRRDHSLADRADRTANRVVPSRLRRRRQQALVRFARLWLRTLARTA